MKYIVKENEAIKINALLNEIISSDDHLDVKVALILFTALIISVKGINIIRINAVKGFGHLR
ncbi:MAG: hypothetical protein VX818_01560, partial [Candidatus Neomarinimicrobiota bacterium]|nr:hypothetical protein [Candidatus Neomarinimicrobiota bacterium]